MLYQLRLEFLFRLDKFDFQKPFFFLFLVTREQGNQTDLPFAYQPHNSPRKLNRGLGVKTENKTSMESLEMGGNGEEVSGRDDVEEEREVEGRRWKVNTKQEKLKIKLAYMEKRTALETGWQKDEVERGEEM